MWPEMVSKLLVATDGRRSQREAQKAWKAPLDSVWLCLALHMAVSMTVNMEYLLASLCSVRGWIQEAGKAEFPHDLVALPILNLS